MERCKIHGSHSSFVSSKSDVHKACHTFSVPGSANTWSSFISNPDVNFSEVLCWLFSVSRVIIAIAGAAMQAWNQRRTPSMFRAPALKDTENSEVPRYCPNNISTARLIKILHRLLHHQPLLKQNADRKGPKKGVPVICKGLGRDENEDSGKRNICVEIYYQIIWLNLEGEVVL